MKYRGLPSMMWICARRSFKRELWHTLHFTKEEAHEITKKAHLEYEAIIKRLPLFEKSDRYEANIVNCALFSAYILHMPYKPTIEEMTLFYSKAMMTKPVKAYYRLQGLAMFSPSDIKSQQKTAALKAADRNPYSWRMVYLPYKDGSGYECRFDRCGICVLMNELGLKEYISAMCHLDYEMTAAGKKADFIRQYTLASGGPYCDCGYKKKNKEVKNV